MGNQKDRVLYSCQVTFEDELVESYLSLLEAIYIDVLEPLFREDVRKGLDHLNLDEMQRLSQAIKDNREALPDEHTLLISYASSESFSKRPSTGTGFYRAACASFKSAAHGNRPVVVCVGNGNKAKLGSRFSSINP